MLMIKKGLLAVARRIVWGGCFFIPVRENRIVVSSYYGRGYGDNLKPIVDKLIEEDKNIEIIWLTKNSEEANTLPLQVKSCQYGSLRAIYFLATAKIWLDNCRRTFLYKKKKQKYLQTWHGFALKRIEADVKEQLSEKYVKTANKDSANTDLIISDSHFMTEIYKNSFWYSGPVEEWGAPRNDILINQQEGCSKKVREHFGLHLDDKLVIYAPTFRADGSINAYSLDYERLKAACEKRFGGSFIVLVRLHPNIVNASNKLGFDSAVRNASFYPDMQELLGAANVVVSDYSSLMFDFALTRRPCFQFATDIDDYKNDRNFYFDLSTLPFTLGTNNESLERQITTFDEKKYQQKLDVFFKSVGMVTEGKAAQKCVDWIFDQMRK